MPTWATGRFKLIKPMAHSLQRGFSLLELLVVLAIAALMTSLAVAWLDSGRSSIDQALDRLAAVTVAQADLARHAGQLRGLRWNGQRPEFVRRQGEHWQVETVALGDWPKGLRPDWPVSQAPALLFTPMAGHVRALCAGAGPRAVSAGTGTAAGSFA